MSVEWPSNRSLTIYNPNRSIYVPIIVIIFYMQVDYNVSSRFRIIAYHSGCPKLMTVDSQELLSIKNQQKKMFGVGWLSFYEGYVIKDKDNVVTLTIDGNVNEDASLFHISDRTSVSVCAVVGENGSGKSSLIEMIIRVMNNVSAAAFGEGYNSDSAEHLFYIENVYAGIICEVDGNYYLIEVAGRSVKICKFCFEDSFYFVNRLKAWDILSPQEQQNDKARIAYKKPNVIKLENLFYTIIYNYSLYSYNYHDYYAERTIQNRWEISGFNPNQDCEDNVWLKGLFHKNDGYMVPIVLNPMRESGQIIVPKENKLAKERQLSLLFYQKINEIGERLYPLRVINKDKVIVGIKLSPNIVEYTNTYILDQIGYNPEDFTINFKSIKEEICRFWRCAWGIKRPTCKQDLVNKAWNYVVYKTLKICAIYKNHNEVIDLLKSKKYNRWNLELKLYNLFMDQSHITLKLRRTLAFLKYGIYNDKQGKYYLVDVEQKLDNIFRDVGTLTIEYGDPFKYHRQTKNTIYLTRQDLLPPPIFDVDFILKDGEKNEANLNTHKDEFSFAGLSSGERQVAYTISNFLYHLVNLDSVHDCGDKKPGRRVRYHNVFVIFDEVELYFHPDLQRRFLDILLSALKCADFRHISGINMMIVTHSPFILSDIPKSNVLFLGEHHRCDIKETFCSNIHEMLNSSFFMEYSIGEIGRVALEEIASLYNGRDNFQLSNLRKKQFENHRETYEYVVSHIGDAYLAKCFRGFLDALKDEFMNQNDAKQEIQRLNERICKLKLRLQEGQ